METWDERIKRSIKRRKFLMFALAAFFGLNLIFAVVKMPVAVAGWFVPFQVATPAYIPLEVEKQYGEVSGFNRVKLVYETDEGTFTVWATSDIGWNNVSQWDEQIALEEGTPAYYNAIEQDDIQMISWRNDDIEYAVDYQGPVALEQEELIKIASSFE